MTGISAPPAQAADLAASARPASVSLGDAEVVELPARVSANLGASAGRGITLTGTVQSQTPDGTVTLRTAAGDVQLRTNTPLPTDRPVTVQVASSGDGGTLRAQITTTPGVSQTPATPPPQTAGTPVLTPNLLGAAAEAQLLRTLAATLPDLPLATGAVLRAIRLPDGITAGQLFTAAVTPLTTGTGGAAATIPLAPGALPTTADPATGNAPPSSLAAPAAGTPPGTGAAQAPASAALSPQPASPPAGTPAGAAALPQASPQAPSAAAPLSPTLPVSGAPAAPATVAGSALPSAPSAATSPASGSTAATPAPPPTSPPAPAPAATPSAGAPSAALGPAPSPAATASLASLPGTGALAAAEALARTPIVTRIARPAAPAGPGAVNSAAGSTTAPGASSPAPASPAPGAGTASPPAGAASTQTAPATTGAAAGPAVQAARVVTTPPLSAISALQETETEPVAAIARSGGGTAASPGPVPPGGSLSVRILAAPSHARAPLAPLPPLPLAESAGMAQRATIIDRTSQGAPVIGIGTARYLLETTQALPIDSELTVALLPDDLLALPALPADPDAATLARGMPALDDGLELLAALNPALGEMLRRTLVPRPDIQLAPSLTLLLTALRRGGDAAGWIGGAAAGLLRSSPQGGATLKRMGEELSSLRHSAFDSAGNEWRGYTVPLEAGALLQPVQFYLRGAGNDTESPEDAATRQAAGVRFLIDLELSRLGPLQLEGLSRPAEQRLDMVLRSGTGWQREMEGEIRGLYVSALQASGLGGTVIFQSGFDGWVRLTRERSAAHVGTVNI
jgi:hypothetical protein